MATPLHQSYSSRWPSEASPTGSPMGQRNYVRKDGFRREKTDKMDLVLAYTGSIGAGKFGKAGTPLASDGMFYHPDSESGHWPWTGTPPSGYDAKAVNRAYEKFKERALGDSTQIGVLLAERKEAYGMVANRVMKLYRSYRHLRRGNFRDFLRELSVKPKRKHRSVVRTAAGEASGLWLEYWFGWAPTVNDLYTVGTVLAGPPPSQRYHGASGQPLPTRVNGWKNGAGTVRARTTQQGVLIVKTGADVDLVNADLQLLQQLGLINPVSIAWELIPFSFVVDWFTSFGNVIDSTTDFVGTNISNPYTTHLLKASGTWETWYKQTLPWVYHYQFYRHTRTKSLLRPVATYPRLLNFGNSKTRAATAVSLLTQIFLDK